MRAAILLAGVLGALLACGSASDAPADEPWPISSGAPGVLGYVALPAAPEDIAEACRQAIGWTPAGLSGGLPVALLLLDEKVFSSPLGLSLAIDDEDAFRASLEQCPALRHLRGDSWVIALSAGHPVLAYLRALRGLTAAQTPADLLASARLDAGAEWPFELVIDDGWASLAPTFEAGLVARRVLGEIPGFSQPDGPIVFSFDARRFHLAYQEEIAGLVNKTRGMLLGVKMAGMAAMLQQMRNGGQEGADLGLPIPGAALWALLEMLSVDQIEGAQLSLRGPDGGELVRDLMRSLEEGDAAEGPAVHGRDMMLGVRLVWSEGSPPARILQALRPVAEVPGAGALGFAPEQLPGAVAEWCRPLAELTMGEGPPAERLMGRIADLLAPCQGTLIVGLEEGGRALAVPLRDRQAFDGEGAGEVLGLLARTLGLEDGLEDGLGGLQPWDGLETEEGLVPGRRHWESDGVSYLTFGDCSEGMLDRLAMHAEEAAVVPRPTGRAPFLVTSVGGIQLRAYSEGNEFQLDLPLPDDPER